MSDLPRDIPLHRLSVKSAVAAVATQALIELRLGCKTWTQPEDPNETDHPDLAIVWAIYFDAPADVDLDFLRPAILPPKTNRGEEFSRRMLS